MVDKKSAKKMDDRIFKDVLLKNLSIYQCADIMHTGRI